MRRDRTQAARLHHRIDIGTTASQALAIIGAFENLIDKRKNGIGRLLTYTIEDILETPHFSIKVGIAICKRIRDAETTIDLVEARLQRCGTDNSTRIRQAEIDPHRAQKGTFTRH